MDDLSALRDRLAACRARIDEARERAGRTEPVILVAVTKTHPADLLRTVREAGIADVGENRVGELAEKTEVVGRDSFRWHLLGHLQRNKARRAAPLFHLLHSLDSPELAQMLAREGAERGEPVRALVQVNASGEAAKSGIPLAGALDTIARFCDFDGLRIEGLMTMAPFSDDEVLLRRTFAAARRLWEDAAAGIPEFAAVHLSMGMSNDFEIAVEEGSNLVRLGTALFGERQR